MSYSPYPYILHGRLKSNLVYFPGEVHFRAATREFGPSPNANAISQLCDGRCWKRLFRPHQLGRYSNTSAQAVPSERLNQRWMSIYDDDCAAIADVVRLGMIQGRRSALATQ